MDAFKADDAPSRLSRADFLKASAAAAGTGLALGALPMLGEGAAAEAVHAGVGGMGYERPWRASDGPYMAWADKHITVVPGSPADRAVRAVKALKLSGATVTTFAEDLTTLCSQTVTPLFQRHTSVKINNQSAPFLSHVTKIMGDVTVTHGAYDVVFAEQSLVPDLVAAGYAYPLDDWVAKYNPALSDYVHPLDQLWTRINGHVYGLPTDGDIFIFYYRKDLLNDPMEKANFKKKYGRPLAVPRTWDEFRQVAEFFTRPHQGLYGVAEPRVKGFNYYWFFQRFGALQGQYFDPASMKPGINGPEGIKALEDLKDQNQFMAPDVLSWGYAETLTAYQQGHAAMISSWPALGKSVEDPTQSKVVGRTGYATVPGYLLNGKLSARSTTAPGYCLTVSRYSKNPLLTYLYAQYVTSPEILKYSDMNPAGNTDAIRVSIYADPQVRNQFVGAGAYLDAQQANGRQAHPELIIPGTSEYEDALEIQLSNYMSGGVSAKAALDQAAADWERITNRHGRDKQKAVYAAFVQTYRKATGIPRL
jgi:multiple sugar transport system substrate-binding protein